MEDKQKLYTTPEAAELLGVTSGHMRTMIARGIAKPHQRLGHFWVFTLDEIERLRIRPKIKSGRPRKIKSQ